jgi:hypothetical protein
MKHSDTFRIRHTVVFRLRHPKDSPEERDFLDAGKKLASIPGVEHFEALKQIGKKNDFDWGFSMEFVDQDAYDKYNSHPDHVSFVEQRWMIEVKDFLEIDYKL